MHVAESPAKIGEIMKQVNTVIIDDCVITLLHSIGNATSWEAMNTLYNDDIGLLIV